MKTMTYRIRLAIARLIAPIPVPRVHTIALEIPVVLHTLDAGIARIRRDNAFAAMLRDLDA